MMVPMRDDAEAGDDSLRIRPTCVALRRGQVARLRILGVRLEMNVSQLIRVAVDALLEQHGYRRATAEPEHRTAAGD